MPELRPSAPALPTSVEARSLNDDVEEIHLKLWENPDYQQLFLPIWREETVEGSFIADEMVAAMQVRSFAVKNAVPIAARAKLHAIVHSLKVVCKRYGISRQERQRLVGGEYIGRTANGTDHTDNDE